MITIYTDIVYEHFMCPQNVYIIDNPNGESVTGEPSCGDTLFLYIRVENNIIEEISYLVQGCCASIATSSMTSVMAKGKTIEEALKITEQDIIEALGGLPPGKEHCSNLGINGLRKAIENYSYLANISNNISR